jgi:small subunit ribosomal protein S9
MKEKVVLTSGSKKTAKARVRAKKGLGIVKINNVPLKIFQPEVVRDIISEPIQLAEKVLGKELITNIDIRANVHGGGVMGQAYACRTALGKALVELTESDALKKYYLGYDRSLLIDDIRVKEPKKYLRKGARAKPIKSYR